MARTLDITAADGFRLSAYRADPAGTPRGGLVVVQEIFGVNSHIRSVCDGYAREGYVAIAPALFDRIQRGVELSYGDDDIAKGRDFKAGSDTQAALRDVAAAIDAVRHAGKVGIVGYCWGGYIAWMAAAGLDRLACAVPYYGGGMLEAMSEQPKCPVMAHFGRKDTHIPAQGVAKLQAAHPAAKVFLYDAGHGFNCDERGSYDETAARLARERTIAFLHQHIG